MTYELNSPECDSMICPAESAMDAHTNWQADAFERSNAPLMCRYLRSLARANPPEEPEDGSIVADAADTIEELYEALEALLVAIETGEKTTIFEAAGWRALSIARCEQ